MESHSVFAVYDEKGKLFITPMAFPNAAVAIRWFETECTRGQTDLARYPADFSLMKLGVWSPDSGAFENVAVPVRIANGADFQKGAKSDG